MENQKSLQLASKFSKPRTNGALSFILREKEYEQNYVLHRIKLPPIEISKSSRDEILKRMDSGKTFVQLGDCTVMINTIASIDPLPRKDGELKSRIDEMKQRFEKEDEEQETIKKEIKQNLW